MSRSFVLGSTALLATGAVLVAGAPEVAAQANRPIEMVIEEVLVTSRRREESLQDVPIAVSAFTAARLDELGAIDITTLQQSTPNLTLQIARGSNSTLIAFIRGVGQQDPLWGFEPGVGLYVDDVYVARPQGAVLDIYDIERVEVLRGPQGTLYGRNTIGGAVKYVTRSLGKDPRFNARVNLGSHEQRDVILSGSGALGETFAVGAAAAVYRRDGYGRNLLTGAEHYNKDVDAFRVSAEWTPSENLFFRIAGDLLNDNSNPRHGYRMVPGSGLSAGEPVLGNRYDTRAGMGDENSVKTRGVSLLGEWSITDDFTFKSITAYREGSTRTVIDFDMGPAPALDIPGRYDDDQLTQEFQLLYTGERIQAVGGVYYLDATASGAFDTVLGIANLAIATSGEVRTESYAAFADLVYNFNDQWAASVGGRYTRDEKEGSVYRQNFAAAAPWGSCGGPRSPLFTQPGCATPVAGLLRTNYTSERTFSEFTPRASLSWKPAADLMLYTSFSRGFKSGGFDMRGDAFAFPGTADGYNPELVDTYEIGGKTLLANGRVSLAAAVFRSDYEDQQITSQFALPTVPPTIVSFVDNAGSSKISGAELEGSFRLSNAFSANLQLGWIDAEFKEFVTFDPATNTRRNLADQRAFQNTPEFTGALSLAYRHNLGNRGVVSFVPAVSYRGKYQMFEIPIPALDQKAYTLVDASLAWESASGEFSAGIYGRNLTDEAYRIGGYNFPGATFGNSVNAFWGPPRTWTASFRYSFN
jgi:iron complex outermembrane recepter protein